jgi:hypothetical protein
MQEKQRGHVKVNAIMEKISLKNWIAMRMVFLS